MSEYVALRDLGDLVENTKKRVATEFTNEDIGLSSGFKRAFAAAIRSSGYSVQINKTTSVITTSANQHIFLPNQWFVLASYAVDLVIEIVHYRDITEAVLDANINSYKAEADTIVKKKQKVYDALKGQNNGEIIKQFKDDILAYLHGKEASQEQAEKDADLLIRFVSDERWWLGGKNISRTNDFYVSPTLRVLNLVNASQSYVATITWLYIIDEKLANELATMTVADIASDADDAHNEYERAARYLQAYVSTTGYEIPTKKGEIEAVLAEFNSKFSPDVLAALPDDELLKKMFYTADDNQNSLCYWLEENPDCRKHFGSITGGSAYKFGLFQKKATGEWITGSRHEPQILTAEEALVFGRNIRDALVKAATIIQKAHLNSVADYEQLNEELEEKIGPMYCGWAWFHKYLSMVCPDKLSSFHSDEWQKHLLYALKIKPSEKKYTRSGQLAMIENYAGWYYGEFKDVVFERFGGKPIHFVRIGTSDDKKNYAAEWNDKSVVGIGWRDIGSLEDYVGEKGIDKDTKAAIAVALKEKYDCNNNVASRKAGELICFYKTDVSTVMVAMDGERLLAFIDRIGNYFYDPTSAMANMKHGTWHQKFSSGEKLPQSEGNMTSCYPLTNEQNLMFLYERYYYEKEEIMSTVDDIMFDNLEDLYNTNLVTEYERNRITFGAPGTGKSFNLKRDCEECLKGTSGSYERVTFHPDYTYSQFVGTYKPVSDSSIIRYEFVPGPFMRVYVEAMKSACSLNPQPHILIIEEINRAKVASVFGDVFQLLDRDENGVSEYEIQTSEDIRRYLASELKCDIDKCKKIKMPNNMFIWATMNSADQGVFPMDTAFKRRWDFEYLGIDENQDKINGRISVGRTPAQQIEWNVLRRAINEKLAKEYRVNEDKLMGPFFISKRVLKTVGEEDDTIMDEARFIEVFKSKVIMYLYEDAAKQHKHKLFSGCEDTTKYSAVCDAFDEIGIQIFGEDFEEVYYNPQKG